MPHTSRKGYKAKGKENGKGKAKALGPGRRPAASNKPAVFDEEARRSVSNFTLGSASYPHADHNPQRVFDGL
jgi:hypothetical protein